MTGPRDGSRTRVDRLLAAARDATAVRRYQTDPDVVALQVERIRSRSNVVIWVAILLGLGFTMVNVQQFAARDAEPWSLMWVTAWLLDPMVSLVLIAVLLAEQVTSRYQIPIGGWPRVAKWFTLTATYAMNTWTSWASGNAAMIVLHSVPPALVFVAVEAFPVMRDRLTEAVYAAEREARRRGGETETPRPSVTVDTVDTAETAWTRSADEPADETGQVDPAAADETGGRAADVVELRPDVSSAPKPPAASGDMRTDDADDEVSSARPNPADGDVPSAGEVAPSGGRTTRTTGHRPADETGGRRDRDRRTRRGRAGGRDSRTEPDIADLIPLGQEVYRELADDGPVTRDRLMSAIRARGHSVGTDRATALWRAVSNGHAPTLD